MTKPSAWQKSSYSGAGEGGECVELATVNGTVHLRESEAPGDVLTVAPSTLAALIRGITQTC